MKSYSMKKILLLTGVVWIICISAYSGRSDNDTLLIMQDTSYVSRQDSSYVGQQDSSRGENIDYIENAQIQTNFDSLLNQWYIQTSNNHDTSSFSSLDYNAENDSIYSSIPDSVYRERLARIPSVIPLTYNRIVRNFIEMYLYKRRDRVEVMAGLANYYFPQFDDIFDSYGVPTELKYMSVIESALNSQACSRTRAIGLWQFMYGTGRLYGLTINSLVDERKDPIKATQAAVRFSKDLYSVFQDWQLVVAAYNCGPGNVNKAIHRSGKRTFWEIYYYLPRETRGHVPAFIAAVYVMNYYREHGIQPRQTNFPIKADTVMISQDLHLMQVAEVLNIPITLLRDMNPQYIHDIIPARGGLKYPLCLPAELITKFINNEKNIYSYKDSIYLNKNEWYVKGPTAYNFIPSGKFQKIRYVVKSGETLGGIAERYGVRVIDIKLWNNIYHNTIRSGQKLTLYIAIKNKKGNNTVAESNTKINNSPVVSNNNEAFSNNGNYSFYTVKQGDTIWDIIKKYPGMTLAEVKKINNLTDEDKIIPGQKIKVVVRN